MDMLKKNVTVSPARNKGQANRDFIDATLKRREQAVKQKEIRNAEEEKRLQQQKLVLEQQLEDFLEDKKEFRQEKRDLQANQEIYQKDLQKLSDEKIKFDSERKNQIIGFIIEGFFIALIVGLLVNQITDVITYFKNYFWNNTIYPSGVVYATAWIIFGCIILLLMIFLVNWFKTKK